MFSVCPRCGVQVVDGICRCTDPELFRSLGSATRAASLELVEALTALSKEDQGSDNAS